MLQRKEPTETRGKSTESIKCNMGHHEEGKDKYTKKKVINNERDGKSRRPFRGVEVWAWKKWIQME